MKEFGCFHLFCGSGGGALGFDRARLEWRGITGRFRNLGGVDADPEACADFEALTGAPATVMDLFSREDYIAYHGQEPPEGWREVVPEDLRRAAGERPDVIFTSPPCQGFSGLLPMQQARSDKYQALNRLTFRGIWLALEAWRDDPPGLILLENVPRITTRGTDLLADIKALLTAYGYAVTDGLHDAGELGGLAQRRRRYLLIARHQSKVPAFVYRPVVRPLRSIGDVLGPLPMPDDTRRGGPMHRLPRVTWKTWLRLALIPAGGDWRDLMDIDPGRYFVQPHMGDGTHPGKHHVLRWDEPSTTVTGARMGSGAAAIADPRLGHVPRSGVYRIGRWDEPATTIVASARIQGSNGIAAVADPRVPRAAERHTSHYRVVRWDEPAGTVTGATHVANGAPCVADPRIGCRPWSGAYRVARWHEPAPTVTSAGDIHSQGAGAVSDPRLPVPGESGVWVIVAEDGTWHRPLTSYEFAMLQGFPTHMPDGRPLQLTGCSQKRWRERIGNAVPPPAAQAIAEAMLLALVPSSVGAWAMNAYGTGVWVRDRDQDAQEAPVSAC